VINGDDLFVAVVRLGAELTKPNASVLCRQALPGFLQMDPALRRSELARVIKIAGDASELRLTIPSAWCALHPIGLCSAQWDQARDEIVRSIDRMLPLDPDDADVGLIDIASANAEPSDPAVSGMLVGVAGSRVEPWLSALGEAMGEPVMSVRSEQIAALGLGLQHEEIATVVEPDGSAHLLRWGRMTAIGELLDEADAHQGKRLTLTDDPDDEDGGPWAIAIASALVDAVTPGSFRPLTGPAAKQPRRWLAPAACAVLAIAMLMLASTVSDRRHQGAIAKEQQRQAQLSDALAETQRLRLETERLTRLLNDGVVATVDQWEDITPTLIEVHAAISNGGTLHRLDLDRTSIAVRGETRDNGVALRALESSPAFTRAEFTAPVTTTTDGAYFIELRADRVSSGSGGASE
jgi:heme exporter protein D